MGWGTLKSKAAIIALSTHTYAWVSMRTIACPVDDCQWVRAMPRRNALAVTSKLRKELRVHLQEKHDCDREGDDGE